MQDLTPNTDIQRIVRACIGYLLLACSISAVPVNAQTLWKSVSYGMSQQDVLLHYGDAAPIRLGSSTQANDMGLQLGGVILGDLTVELRFIFKDGQLTKAFFRQSINSTPTRALAAYDSVRTALQSSHPIKRELSSKRIVGQIKNVSGQIRYVEDALGEVLHEWDATDETAVEMKLLSTWQGSYEIMGTVSVAHDVLWERKNKLTMAEADARAAHHLAVSAAQRKHDEDRYGAELLRWDGKQIKEFIHARGAPTSRLKLDANETVYVWEERAGDMNCRTSVFVDNKGKVRNWQWKGNNCRKK